MIQFNLNQAVGDIVLELPLAGEVFQNLQIDFCCGGQRPLREAIQERGLQAELVLDKLLEASQTAAKLREQTNYAAMPTAELVDYIVNKHHAFLKTNLPKISELAVTILRVHGSEHPHLFTLHKLFHELKTELDQHLIKEEILLFPLMKENAPKEEVAKVLAETEAEHDEAGEIVHELRRITNNYQAPADGCTTYHLTYKMLAELEKDLFQHIHLENNLLFKRFA